MLRTFLATLFGSGARPGARSPLTAVSAASLKQSIERAHDLVANRQFDKAGLVCREILTRHPENIEALSVLVHTLMGQGDLNAAKALADTLIQRCPGHAQAYCLRGDIYRERRSFKSALHDYMRAADIDPLLIEARMNQGAMHYMLGEFEKALACARNVLLVDSDNAAARRNVGLMLRELGFFADAEMELRNAIAMHPDHHETRCSLAMVLLDQGLFEEARQHLEVVLDADSAHNEARWQSSVAYLLDGCFREGWRTYDSRLRRDDARSRPYKFPEWHGAAMRSGALLVYAEQGLGDDILFASCFPDVLSRVTRCIVECDSRLVELFQRSFPGATIVGSKNDSAPDWLAGSADITAQIAAGSLPGLFRNEQSEFPDHRGYLVANPGKVDRWRARLAQLGSGLKVGIAWTGGGIKTRRRLRSLSLPDMLPVLGAQGAHFVSLQYVECGTEISAVHAGHGLQVHHWQEAIDDYDETAALVSALDLVISVCTSIVHLSGALGKPVWVMVPFSPEWRYLRAGERLPWYSSARLFRQRRGQDWGPVVAAVSSSLYTLLQEQAC